MSADVEALQVKVTADTADAEKGLKKTDDAAKSSHGHLTSWIGDVAKFVTAIGITNVVGDAFNFLKGQIGDTLKVAEDYQVAQSQLVQGLKSTHDASGMTVKGMDDLAESYSKVTMFSDTAILQSEGITLTFTNIGKNVFPQATMAAEDLATRMGEDLPSATLQLDKALGDPIKGYAQLQRVGVVFTQSQVDQIKAMSKAGNVAGAQAIILKELQKEFGGSAKAAGQTFAGQLQILQNQLEITKEKVGTALLPILTQLLQVITPLAGALMDGLAAAFTAISGVLQSQVMPAIQPVLVMLPTLWGIVQNVANAFMSGLKPALDGIGKSFSDAGTQGSPLVPFFTQLGQNLEKAAPLAQHLGTAIGQAIQLAAPIVKQFVEIYLKEMMDQLNLLWNIVQTDVFPVLKDLAGVFVKTVLPAIQNVSQWADQHLTPVIQNIANFLKTTGVPIFNTLADVFANDILPAAEQVGAVITDKILPPLLNILSKVLPILNPLLQFLGWLLKNVVGPALALVGNIIAGVLTGIDGLLTAAGWVKDRLGDLAGAIGNAIGGIIKGGLDLIIIGVNTLIGLLDTIQVHIPSISVGPVKSPSFDWNGLGIPKIPMLAAGGTIIQGGWTLVGEAGPELLNLTAGAQVRPLSSGGSGGNAPGGVTIGPGTSLTIPVQVNGKAIAQAVLPDLAAAIRNGTGVRKF